MWSGKVFGIWEPVNRLGQRWSPGKEEAGCGHHGGVGTTCHQHSGPLLHEAFLVSVTLFSDTWYSLHMASLDHCHLGWGVRGTFRIQGRKWRVSQMESSTQSPTRGCNRARVIHTEAPPSTHPPLGCLAIPCTCHLSPSHLGWQCPRPQGHFLQLCAGDEKAGKLSGCGPTAHQVLAKQHLI